LIKEKDDPLILKYNKDNDIEDNGEINPVENESSPFDRTSPSLDFMKRKHIMNQWKIEKPLIERVSLFDLAPSDKGGWMMARKNKILKNAE